MNHSDSNEACVEEGERFLSAYDTQCTVMRVHANSLIYSVFKRHAATQSLRYLTTLRLDQGYLGDAGVSCLASLIPQWLPSLKALSLMQNGVANEGVVALCKMLAEKSQNDITGVSPLMVLNIEGNHRITRTGGQTLFHAVSRAASRLCYVLMEGTRVTEYFEARIHRRTAAVMAGLTDVERSQVVQLRAAVAPEGMLAGSAVSSPLVLLSLRRASDNSDAEHRVAVSVRPSGESELIHGGLSSPALPSVAHRASSRASGVLMRPSSSATAPSRATARSAPHSPQFLVDDDADFLAAQMDEAHGPQAPEGAKRSSSALTGTAPSPPGIGFTLPQRHSSQGTSSFDILRVESSAALNPMFQMNAPFDEVWYADGVAVADPPPMPSSSALGRVHSVMEVNRPSAPSGLETILYSATPDFLHVYPENASAPSDGLSKRFTITTMPNRDRTIYGFTTPSLQEVEIFSFVTSFKPKDIILPTKFIFPGTIDYVAAVHAPDPMLHPSLPSVTLQPQRAQKKLAVAVPAPPALVKPCSPLNIPPPHLFPPNPPPIQLPQSSVTAADLVAGDDSDQRASMFWSFFHSASAAAASASAQGTPREQRTPTQVTPRSHMPLMSETVHHPQGGTPQHVHRSAPATTAPAQADSPAPTTPEEATASDTDSQAPGLVSPQRSHPGTPKLLSAGNGLGSQSSMSGQRTMDAVALLLTRVLDPLLSATPMLSSKPASFPLPSPAAVAHAAKTKSKSLSELLLDPQWAPARPTRASQVTDYCQHHKLSFETISRERKKAVRETTREYYLQRIIRPSITDSLSAGAMNTLGNMLVTSNYDMTCKLWDLDTGKKVHTFRGHTGHISDCAWNAPICDRVITSSFDKTLKIWSVGTGELLHTLRGHELEVVCVAVSTDGSMCASGAMDDTAILWDIERGTEKFTFQGHAAEVIALDFSPVGNMLVSGSMDETVRVWSTADGSCIRVFEGHSAEVGQVKFNCFGNIILSGSIDGTCRLWEVKSGRHKCLRGHTHEVVDCDFAPDGWTCASASDDGTVRIWDVLSGGCLLLIVGHERGVCRLAFTANGKELITGSLDATAKVWNVESGECKQTLRGHNGLVLVTYNSTSEKILTLSRDNTCRIWKLEPEWNTMFHAVAATICSQPTLYGEAVSTTSLPPSATAYLSRIYKRMFQSSAGDLSPQLRTVKSPDVLGPEETVDTEENEGNATATAAAGEV